MFLNRRGDGYALGDDERDGVDRDGDGSVAILHSRRSIAARRLCNQRLARWWIGLHGADSLCIAAHDISARRFGLAFLLATVVESAKGEASFGRSSVPAKEGR